MRAALLLALLVGVASACGDDPTALPDGGLDAGPLDGGGDGGPLDGGPPDAGPVDTGLPRRCDPGEACSDLLDEAGICKTACIPQRTGVTCRGTVQDGLCQRIPIDPPENPMARVGGLMLRPDDFPTRLVVGERATFQIVLTNPGLTTRRVRLGAMGSPWLQIESSELLTAGVVDLAGGTGRSFSTTVLAVAANVFLPGRTPLFTVHVEGEDHGLAGVVEFGPDGNLACGDHHFPETYFAPEGGNFSYFSARCCDGVFYPSTNCCTDLDCAKGMCADGRCIEQVPMFTLADTPPRGIQRVLTVTVDGEGDPANPCAELGPASVARSTLAEAEAYFRGVMRDRAGRDDLRLVPTALGGLTSTDFVTGADGYFPAVYLPALEAHLVKLGCIASFRDYDKIIVASPFLDFPFGGQAIGDGRIVLRQPPSGLLVAHELGHTFGANDLYLDLGGFFQFRYDLMGNHLGEDPWPEDGVMWGEIGYGDADKSGVIDVAEIAVNPEALSIARAEARLTTKDTLEVEVELAAVEGGAERRVWVRELTLRLVELGAERSMTRANVFIWDGTEIDLAKVAADGHVKVQIVAEQRFTSVEGERVSLAVDETLELPVR